MIKFEEHKKHMLLEDLTLSDDELFLIKGGKDLMRSGQGCGAGVGCACGSGVGCVESCGAGCGTSMF